MAARERLGTCVNCACTYLEPGKKTIEGGAHLPSARQPRGQTLKSHRDPKLTEIQIYKRLIFLLLLLTCYLVSVYLYLIAHLHRATNCPFEL